MKYSLVANSGGSVLTVDVNGEWHTTTSENPHWDQIVPRVLEGDETVVDLFSPAKVVSKRFESITDRVKVQGGVILFDGDPIDNSLTRQVLRFMDEGEEDFLPLVYFFEKVMTNPEPHSREQLYDWVARHNITINPDGDLVLFKGVRKADHRSDVSSTETNHNDLYESVAKGKAIVNDRVFEGHIPQWLGAVVEMPRSEVHHDPSNGCSSGLHASSSGSLAKSYSGGGTVLEVVVNPRDVVSVPHDGYNKVRVTKYRVVDVDAEEYDKPFVDKWSVERQPGVETSVVVPRWGDDFDDDEDDYYDEDDYGY